MTEVFDSAMVLLGEIRFKSLLVVRKLNQHGFKVDELS